MVVLHSVVLCSARRAARRHPHQFLEGCLHLSHVRVCQFVRSANVNDPCSPPRSLRRFPCGAPLRHAAPRPTGAPAVARCRFRSTPLLAARMRRRRPPPFVPLHLGLVTPTTSVRSRSPPTPAAASIRFTNSRSTSRFGMSSIESLARFNSWHNPRTPLRRPFPSQLVTAEHRAPGRSVFPLPKSASHCCAPPRSRPCLQRTVHNSRAPG